MERDSLPANQPESPNPAKPRNSTVPPNPAEPNWRLAPLRYRLIHFFYAMALFAASFALFESTGFLVALFVLGFWLIVFMVEPTRYGLAFAVLAAFLFLCLASSCLTLAVMEARRGTHAHTYCPNNLKQLGLGLHNYHDSFGQFPPTYFADSNGNRLHSWRTMILPYTEQSDVYKKYDLSEPWDGPTNSKLHKTRISYHLCPEDKLDFAGETSYVAVCGEGATWTDQNALELSEFFRGSSNTVLVIETHHSGIHWMEPRDISIEAAIQELSHPDFVTDEGHRGKEFFFDYGLRGHNALMADGSVRFIPILSESDARKLLTGKTPEDLIDFESQGDLYRVRYDNIVRLVAFIAIALLPTYRVIVELMQA
jgi:hypothetical protein